LAPALAGLAYDSLRSFSLVFGVTGVLLLAGVVVANRLSEPAQGVSAR
jgi:hypothetical protein